MAQINLDSTALDELNSAETRTIFDTADRLSSLGVGRIVNLPQIIVVGDQSSGKSSVLEAISHVHFPVHGGVCTRFATELVLRPGNPRSVTASVQFADATRPTHSLQVTDFNQEDIANIIATAKDEMGLSDTGRGFSKDVLRLEIQGPDMYPLTLVDLPGIFHTATAKQSPEGMATVMELVESYMRRPNSIILGIIAANNQLANQVVMQEAAKHDPSKTRTLGVITKPDLLHPGSSSEQDYLQIVRGRDAVHNLALGWHVLRNLADYETDRGPRDTVEEQFFSSQAWGSIPGANRGVGALRAKLSRILHDHIRKSLPAVLQDIQDKLSHTELELDRLGQPRNTPEAKRAYLIDIASHFQRLVQDGIRGHYTDPFFGGFNGSHRKLRSNLRNFNRAIRHILITFGSTQKVTGGPYDVSLQPSPPGYLGEFLEVYTDNPSLHEPETITWRKLSSKLERRAASHQGTELPGEVNKEIVIQLFQKQARPWKNIAALHNEEILKLARMFVNEAFEHIVGSSNPNSTIDAILDSIVLNFFVEKEQQLSTKLEEIFRPYYEGYARPLDTDFQEALATRATERAADSSESANAVSEALVGAAILSRSHNEFGTDRMIHSMQTFYDMSLRTFTDNLINLGIESCLIQDLPNIFTPRLVNDMDDEQLERLAGESEDVRSYRSQLRDNLDLLKQGLEQCRRYRPRETSRVPSSTQPGRPALRQNIPASRGSRPTSASNNSGQPRIDGAVSAATQSPSRGGQERPPAASKPVAGSGSPGNSTFVNSFSNLAIGSNSQPASGANSSLFSSIFSNNTSAATPSTTPGNMFSHLATSSPAFGSTPNKSQSLFSGFGAASPRSSSTNMPVFGDASGAQTNATSSARQANVPATNPFGLPIPPSLGTSGSPNKGTRFGGE
ncbi:hypothetical protein KVR01_007497 [Diaporthe batatas]|uniref:uncharacterized protein n=1 Tax=Diaporthe batatas TaxID=748121 RepID=UPI001D053B30|nr:uncharacterized protein KVR01_007497 [Diaporthe batatas]KAG8163019.1 hypothetical protein KVR01_007497 [Diaporthe batatas]